MKLSELQQLQAEYEARGYRVAFEAVSPSAPNGDTEEDTLTRDDGNGWPSPEEAYVHAQTLQKIGGPSYRNIRVVGPSGEPWTPPSPHDTATAVPPLTSVPDAPPPPPPPIPPAPRIPETPVIVEEPPRDSTLTILAGTGAVALVGDERGLVYALPTGSLAQRQQAGQPVRPHARMWAGERVFGSLGLAVPFVLATHEGIRALVAFADGGWFIKVPRPEE